MSIPDPALGQNIYAYAARVTAAAAEANQRLTDTRAFHDDLRHRNSVTD